MYKLVLTVALLAAASFLARPASAAIYCYFYSEAVGYVCDADPQTAVIVAQAPASQSELNYTPYQAYAKLHDFTFVYPEANAHATPLYNKGAGFIFVAISDTVQAVVTGPDGTQSQHTWYRINPGEYIRAEAVAQVMSPSRFQGRSFSQQPQRPFGWIVSGAYPSSTPGGPPNHDLPFLHRYHFFEVHNAAVAGDGLIWYDVGHNQWIVQVRVSLIDPKPRPGGVGAGQQWVEVDLYEQTFAAYVGDQMVYAGLVATGLQGTVTRPGLFQVWSRHLHGRMTGGEGTSRYYYLQKVPHILYFDDQIGLHGAYWHDGFGFRASRGCVNMSPRDAQWVYNWSAGSPNLWVWVHSSNPHTYFQKYH